MRINSMSHFENFVSYEEMVGIKSLFNKSSFTKSIFAITFNSEHLILIRSVFELFIGFGDQRIYIKQRMIAKYSVCNVTGLMSIRL